MTQPWPDAENVPGEPVDLLGVDGPFQGVSPEDPPDGLAAAPHPSPPSPPPADAKEEGD